MGRFRTGFVAIPAIMASLALWGCSQTDSDSPSVVITSPQDNATVPGPDLQVSVKTSGFTGHFHVFVDQAPFPGGGQTMRSTVLDLPGLTMGSHFIIVQGAEDPDHRFIAGVRDSVKFTVP